MITQERLKELFTYNPTNGLFFRNVGRGGKDAGSIAGTTNSYYGYVSICIDRKHYKAHRLAFLYMTGKMPTEEVDHRDGDRQNNVWTNLKGSNRSENASNCALRSDNESGVVGVGFHKKRKQWRARIKGQHIGWFTTKEEAALAREQHFLAKTFSYRHGKELSMFNNSF